MQTILSIDASVMPPLAVVVGIEKSELTILEQYSSSELFVNWEEELKNILSSIKSKWTNSILFLNPEKYLSLNLSLPFSDSKTLDRIVSLEVQDVIPFDIEPFVMDHRYVGALAEKGRDIHVGLFPRDELAKLLDPAKRAEFEPIIVTSPGAALQGIFNATDGLPRETVLIVERKGCLHIGVFRDGKMQSDRSLFFDTDTRQINSELEGTIQHFEKRYGLLFPVIYHLCEDTKSNFSTFNREIKTISRPHTDSEKPLSIALFGAIFAQDYPAPEALSNFRVQEFAYSHRWKEVVRGFKQLSGHLIVLASLCIACFVAWFVLRSIYISKVQNAIHEAITQTIPDFAAQTGEEANTLQSKSIALEGTLKDLGSALTTSPLDVLAHLSNEIPREDGIEIQHVTIKSGEVRLDGTAPNYKTLDKLESTLKRKKNVFCKVKSESPGSSGRDNTRQFQITIGLCD